ncbi:high mobility group B protein 7 isoform X2 [Mangifera indica]|uniref:high mobility group B protein 7 isoform X2 n=1 Tax=Mangifera indica TaxID=29780 RepID=UPI001CFC1229|nr:high mobility group B protein 7 isoform X2 [Mangifera indica]
MVNPARTRKRVRALPRAPDGSAFQKCQSCEVLVPIALADMHECERKKEVKRFRGVCEKPAVLKRGSGDHQVRSPFRFFMESFVKMYENGNWIDIDRKGFEAWKSMSMEEKRPYVTQAQKVDDEADSATVGMLMRETVESWIFESSDSE